MTKPGIDIGVEIKKILANFGVDGSQGFPDSCLGDEIVYLCLRVQEATTKAERDRCAEIARYIGAGGTEYDDDDPAQAIGYLILARNGETKNG